MKLEVLKSERDGRDHHAHWVPLDYAALHSVQPEKAAHHPVAPTTLRAIGKVTALAHDLRRQRQRIRATVSEVDLLATWLEVVTDLYEFGEGHRERVAYQLKFRARILHDQLRLSRWLDWIG